MNNLVLLLGSNSLVGETFQQVLVEAYPVIEQTENSCSFSLSDQTFQLVCINRELINTLFFEDENLTSDTKKQLAALASSFQNITTREQLFKKVDFVFSALPAKQSLQVSKVIDLYRHCVLVDFSDAIRLDSDVLLYANQKLTAERLSSQSKFSIPNCVAGPIYLALSHLIKEHRIKRLDVATYQSASGAGREYMGKLVQDAAQISSGHGMPDAKQGIPLAFNVIPVIGSVNKGEFSTEEQKIISELQLLFDAKLTITATAVRVPVLIGHSCALTLELVNSTCFDEVVSLLKKSEFVELSYDQEGERVCTPLIDSASSDRIYISRIRLASPNTVCMWISVDNLRLGAASMARMLLEQILRMKTVTSN